MKQKLELINNNEGIKLDHQSHLVIFDGFTHNGGLYNYLSNLKPEEWNPALHQVIDNGLIVVSASKSYDFEKDFEIHQNKVANELNKNVQEIKSFVEKFSKDNTENVTKEIKEVSNEFDINNKESKISKTIESVKKTLLETYGKDSQLYKEFMGLFSIEKEGSPLHLFLKEVNRKFEQVSQKQELETKELKEKIEKVSEILKIDQKTKELLEKSTQKGKLHEDNVETALRDIAKPFGDTVLNVSRERGSDNRGIGDFEVDFTNGKISVEAKDDNSKSANDVQKEIKATLNNRHSDFVIYTFKNEEQLPAGMEKFTIQNNSIICCSENNQLYLAYRLARKLVEAKKKKSNADLESLHKDIEEMRSESKELTSMSRTASSLVNSSEKMKKSLKFFIVRYEQRVDSLLDKLNSAEVAQ